MIKVNKLAIFKMVREVGLTPIEDSWEVDVERYHSRYYGSSSTTTYNLKTVEKVEIEITRNSGSEPFIYIYYVTKSSKVSVDNLRYLLVKYGYTVYWLYRMIIKIKK